MEKDHHGALEALELEGLEGEEIYELLTNTQHLPKVIVLTIDQDNNRVFFIRHSEGEVDKEKIHVRSLVRDAIFHLVELGYVQMSSVVGDRYTVLGFRLVE